MRFSITSALLLSMFYFQGVSANKDAPLAVIAYEVEFANTQKSIQALGELKATQSVILTSRVADTVAKIHFNDGQQVQKGQLLVEFNQQEELALLKEKRISSDEAKKQYTRLKNLRGRANVSQAQIDEQYRIWQVLEAQINTLKTQLKDRKVVAPFAGQLGLKDFYVGDFIQQGQGLISLNNLQTMQLDLMVSDQYLASIKTGDSLKITSETYPNQEFSAQITAISPQLDSNSRMLKIRAQLDNSANLFKTNMLVTAHINLQAQQQLVVPNKSILMLGDHQYIYRLLADAENPDVYNIEKTKIEIGQISANRTAITQGLKAGDKVVSQGILLVNPRKKAKIKALENNHTQSQLLLKNTSNKAQTKQTGKVEKGA